MGVLDVLGPLIELLKQIFQQLAKDKLEKFDKEWHNDEPKLREAVLKGDLDIISSLTDKYSHL